MGSSSYPEVLLNLKPIALLKAKKSEKLPMNIKKAFASENVDSERVYNTKNPIDIAKKKSIATMKITQARPISQHLIEQNLGGPYLGLVQ